MMIVIMNLTGCCSKFKQWFAADRIKTLLLSSIYCVPTISSYRAFCSLKMNGCVSCVIVQNETTDRRYSLQNSDDEAKPSPAKTLNTTLMLSTIL